MFLSSLFDIKACLGLRHYASLNFGLIFLEQYLGKTWIKVHIWTLSLKLFNIQIVSFIHYYLVIKVKLMWEGHKIWKKNHLPLRFGNSVPKNMRGRLFQIFEAFSPYPYHFSCSIFEKGQNKISNYKKKGLQCQVTHYFLAWKESTV